MRWLYWLDYVFLLRPAQFFPLWATYFSGYITAQKSPFFFTAHFPWLASAAITLTAGHIYLFNQIVNKESDKANGKLFILADGYVSMPVVWSEGIVLVGLSLWLAWQVLIEFFYSALTLSAIGLSYSFLGLMNRPIISLAMNSLGGGVAFIAGAYSIPQSGLGGGSAFWEILFWSVPHIFAYTAVSALVTLPDRKGDEAFGKRTVAVHYGVETTLRLAWVFDGLALLTALLTWNGYVIGTIGLTALVALPSFWKVMWQGDATEVFAPVKLAMLALTLLVSLFFPALLLLVVLNFAACKAYYRYRFGLDYPNFQKSSQPAFAEKA
ncbi:MAG: UbiA family prenyltransferase [Chloroherpetonaceae bacterium]|nr:UbiA family prenyltransferase [Chloroherpetonaceae bacterium]